MNLMDLLGLGYLCEELPPPFNSLSLGSKWTSIQKAINNIPKPSLPKNSLCTSFIAPKVGIYRRHFSIPNPYPQIQLSQAIAANWAKILIEYGKSKTSVSIPEIDRSGERAIVYLDRYEKFRELCIIASSTKQYELHLDIAKYYFTIYTHSIPWAIHTKRIAKTNHKLSLWGNQIDTYIRAAQSNQTKGIPVGTDTSRIVAEIIGCSIDTEFEKELLKHGLNVVGFRFVDDCRYFFDNIADAELALKEYQRILTDYSLNLNDEKTFIKSIPSSFENSWKIVLNCFIIEERLDRKQRIDIKAYFNLLINLSQENPKDSVVKYGIKRLLKLTVHPKNIDIFEPLLCNVTLHEPAVIPDTLELLHKYKYYLSKNGVSQLVLSIINRNIHKGHHFEVSWALWIAKCFKILIPSEVAQQIINSKDVISIIILLDLNSSKQVDGTLGTKDLISDLTQDSLFNELWLLSYEAEFNNWLPLTNISQDPFFTQLKLNGVSFYNSNISNLPAGIKKSIAKEFQHLRSKSIKDKVKSKNIDPKEEYS